MTLEAVLPGDIVVHDRTEKSYVYIDSCLAKIGNDMEWTECVIYRPLLNQPEDKLFVRDKANFYQNFSKATE